MARLRSSPEERSPTELLGFGVVNLDKPPGPSSHEVAGWLRDHAGVDRAGHAGTLDPKVTGSLPIMLGDAVRLAGRFADSRKSYVAVLCLHGEVPTDWRETIRAFETEIYQKPPRKSAVRRRLRTRRIHRLEPLERDGRRVLLRIDCAAGTYVRKLCHHLGLALGTGGHMGDLRRVETGPFEDTDLVTAHDVVDAIAVADEDPEPLRAVVRPAECLLDGLPRVVVAPSAAREIGSGAPTYAPGVIEAGTHVEGTEVAVVTPGGSAVALGELVGDPDGDRGRVVESTRVLV